MFEHQTTARAPAGTISEHSYRMNSIRTIQKVGNMASKDTKCNITVVVPEDNKTKHPKSRHICRGRTYDGEMSRFICSTRSTSKIHRSKQSLKHFYPARTTRPIQPYTPLPKKQTEQNQHPQSSNTQISNTSNPMSIPSITLPKRGRNNNPHPLLSPTKKSTKARTTYHPHSTQD